MNKRLMSLIYLVARGGKHVVNTSNAHAIVNKIPCEHEQFFKPTLAQVYVSMEMNEYPISKD
jgi:hypothetical protein